MKEIAKRKYGRRADTKTAPHIVDLLVLAGIAELDYAKSSTDRKVQGVKLKRENVVGEYLKPYNYKKTAYELVKEVANILGKGGRTFHYSEVISYIRSHYPDCPFKDITFRLHLSGLSKNIESSKRNLPSLYRRAFLIYLGNGRYKLAEGQEIERIEEDEDRFDPEVIAKKVMENYLGVKLEKKKLNIFGKYKEFDLVNVEKGIVGDVKSYKFKGGVPAAQFSNISEYVWLMEKLEQSSGRKWRKFIVGLGNRNTFESYAKRYGPWLGDVEIYFIDDNGKLEILRRPYLGV